MASGFKFSRRSRPKWVPLAEQIEAATGKDAVDGLVNPVKALW